MDDELILSWNVANWVTVSIMAFLGFVLVAMGAQVYQNYRAKQSS